MGVAEWISAFAAVLAVITTIVMFIRTQKYRRLQFLLSSFSLIDVKRSITDKIKIYYDENIVSNLSMIKVKVKNSGKLAIRKEDVVSPIEIVFNEKTKLIDWSVANTEPAGININLERLEDKNAIKCNFGLLNPGDEANLELICIPEDGSIPEVQTRIEGLKHVDVKVEGVEVMPAEMPSFYTKWTLTRVVSTLFGIIFLAAGTTGWGWYIESKFLSVLIAESFMSIEAVPQLPNNQ